MSKAFMSKRKTATAVIAVVMTAVLIFGGTFAWQSISQEALNEVSGTVNPGGRLHDDFDDITGDGYTTMTYNKDVYVENFTSLATNGVQVFARVRLDEYMEIGKNAGMMQDENTVHPTNEAVSLVPGAKLEDKSTWTTHFYDAGVNDVFHTYWNWDFNGQTVYMPTFNKDKNSLEADINGTFDANFADHEDYTLGQAVTGSATYEGGTTASETHTAKNTLDATLISMADWLAGVAADGGYDPILHGHFWVYDTDGWVYWSAPIDPDTATGLLLDGIDRTDVIINEDWYYGINVVAQFVTGDDLGQDDSTGFFDLTEGRAPSKEALLLLNAIGVDVTFEAGTVDELKEALAHGGTVKLTDNIQITEQLTVTEDTVLELGDYTISGSNIWNAENKAWSLISVQGADTVLTINGNTGGLLAASGDSYCVDVRDGAKVIINGGTYQGNISAVYVHTGEAVINGGTFSIQQTDKNGENGYDEMLNCWNENYSNGKAKITVLGGSFYDFNPDNSDDGDLVPTGYNVALEQDGNTTIYKVAKQNAQTAETPNE